MLSFAELLQQHQAAGREDHQVRYLLHHCLHWCRSPSTKVIFTIISETKALPPTPTPTPQGVQLPVLSEELHLPGRSRSVSSNLYFHLSLCCTVNVIRYAFEAVEGDTLSTITPSEHDGGYSLNYEARSTAGNPSN